MQGGNVKKGQYVDAVCMDTKCSLREDPINFRKQNILFRITDQYFKRIHSLLRVR